jgi:DNA modification methylase
LAKGDNNILMHGINYGTSFFDPVLAEIIYLWFMPDKGIILDPFAGEQTKAFIAAAMGHEYHGIEIRADQIEANKKSLEKYGLKASFYIGDSQNLNELIPKDLMVDLIFTSPPYYDLEIYSEQTSEDLSTKQTYEEFMQGYRRIFSQAVEHLKDNRFLILKIGDIRDEQGFYRNFIVDNILIMRDLGLKLYNEIIYVQMLATAPHRAERNMRKRKVVKTHQNVLTFYKGDPEVIKNPRLLEIHEKVLAFYKGDPENIKDEFKNPPPIHQDITEQIKGENIIELDIKDL